MRRLLVLSIALALQATTVNAIAQQATAATDAIQIRGSGISAVLSPGSRPLAA